MPKIWEKILYIHTRRLGIASGNKTQTLVVTMRKNIFLNCSLAIFLVGLARAAEPNGTATLGSSFAAPPDSAKPWVYWYFMDGNLTHDGMMADLQAMKDAGIGGGIFLEVNIGIPRGPVDFMSPEWQRLFVDAAHEADRLGIQIALGSGPGWCGTGGPWIKPELSMQDLVTAETNVTGPAQFSDELPRPQPLTPYFGEGTLTPELKAQWKNYYRDVAVLAFPTPDDANQIADIAEKALYRRDPYSSKPGVKAFLPAPATFPELPEKDCIATGKIIELTGKMSSDGHLTWNVPPGRWTIMRLGCTITGQTTRPAPQPGLGFETDKFNRAALDAHYAAYIQKLVREVGTHTNASGGLTMLHFDSWEMGSQNWSLSFREEFRKRRGYDPLKFLPAFAGHVIGSDEISERFLWDVRQTAQELVVENHVGYLKELAHKNGLTLSVEPYDLNPCGDLTMGRVADVPQCEFWHRGFNTSYSAFEAASIAHTCGKNMVAAEAFTSEPGEDWQADPASLKEQGDWAFCTGVNRFDFHRFQAQPWTNRWPGMTMGPYGVHWDRTQTWWDMVPAYHEYLARCQYLLQRGVTVADVCFLVAEGAPHVFRPPASATSGKLPDHSGYNFDGCAPETLLERAMVQDGKIVFPGGTTYQILVLPEQQTMTPKLLRKIKSLVRDGATVFGPRPLKSPGLENYPKCDAKVKELAQEIWGDCDGDAVFSHSLGKGRVLWKKTDVKSGDQYGDFAAVTNVLSQMNVPPDFEADGLIRFTHRHDGDTDIYFLVNSKSQTEEANCTFRITGKQPELFDPMTGKTRLLPEFAERDGRTTVPMKFESEQSFFVVFRPSNPNTAILQKRGNNVSLSPRERAGVRGKDVSPDDTPSNLAVDIHGEVLRSTISHAASESHIANFLSLEKVLELQGPWTLNYDPKWGGPQEVAFDTLDDWSHRPEPGIKFYSGKAVYRKSFELPDKTINPARPYFLDLGSVKNMARIRLNGHDLGVVWCAPWRVDVTDAIHDGTNQLEIEVANLWPNRLIGDQSLPPGQRFTWTTRNPYNPNSPLLSSGLIGPVTIWATAK